MASLTWPAQNQMQSYFMRSLASTRYSRIQEQPQLRDGSCFLTPECMPSAVNFLEVPPPTSQLEEIPLLFLRDMMSNHRGGT